jgi:23S rRNA (cytidine1920-2'-O)/16S rRNA (cytidine1409-2'-O)-methyltransferase
MAASTRAPLRLDEAVAACTGVTRSRARALIMAGRVRVNGRPATKPGASVASSARIDVERPRPYVSRGGEKLEAALEAFGIEVNGKRALDVGAATGGFTDCLLSRGAAHVVALDVGYGQLAYGLRIDPRVTVRERCNFRLLPDDAFERAFDIITVDASFISVRTMIARALAYLAPGGDIVALIKPQFEAGRDRLGGGGVVRDPAVHRAILDETLHAIQELGAAPVSLARSPLRGPAGNVEFFVRVRGAGAPVDARAVEAALA